jgi:hypothetical protein
MRACFRCPMNGMSGHQYPKCNRILCFVLCETVLVALPQNRLFPRAVCVAEGVGGRSILEARNTTLRGRPSPTSVRHDAVLGSPSLTWLDAWVSTAEESHLIVHKPVRGEQF